MGNNFKNIFSRLPKTGLAAFFDFAKLAKTEAASIIKNVVVKGKKSQKEAKEAAEYAIALSFLEMYEQRYGKKFIKEFVAFYKGAKVRDLIHDHCIIETQKIQTEPEAGIKRSHRANGIMILPKLADKLDTYKMVVAQWEIEHGKPGETEE